MLRILDKNWVLCGLVLLCSFASVVEAQDREALATTIIEQSGVQELLASFPTLLKEGIKQGAKEASVGDDKLLKRIEQAIDANYDLKQSVLLVRSELLARLDQHHMTEVVGWLDSPLGRRVYTMEVAMTDVSVMNKMVKEVPALRQKYRGTEREKLFTRFDTATSATEASVETAISIQLALAGAMAASAPPGAAPTFEQLKAMIDGNRFMLRGLVGQQVYDGYLFTYRELSHEELLQYLAFISSESGQRFTQAMNEALREALRQPSEAIGRSIVDS